MAETREIELQWPIRGLVRSAAVQRQAPYSTPDCLNVRPRDVFEDRVRGGSRPGLTKAYQEDLGDPIQMLTSVRPVATAGGGLKAYDWGAVPAGGIDYDTWEHVSLHKSGTATDVAYWDAWANEIIPEGSVGVSPSETISAVYFPNPPVVAGIPGIYKGAYLHTEIDDQDTADGITYTIRVMRRSPWVQANGLNLWKGYFLIWGGMDSGLDPTQDGWTLEFRPYVQGFINAYGRMPFAEEYPIANSYWQVLFTRYLSGVETHSVLFSNLIPSIAFGNMPIEVRVTNNTAGPTYFSIVVKAGDTEVVNHEDTNSGNEDAGYRWGFGLQNPGEGALMAVNDLNNRLEFPVIDYINYIYKPTTNTNYRKRQLVAASGGDIHYENNALQMEALTSDLTLNPSVHLQSVEYDGKIFIADYGDVVYEHLSGNGTLTSGALDLSSGAPADWTVALGVSGNNFKDWVVEKIDHATGDVEETWRITAVGSGDITVKKKDGTTNPTNDTGFDFRIQRGPKVYDPDEATLDLFMADEGKGQIPTGCRLISVYQDRIVIGRNDYRPGIWWMARQSDPYDWDLSVDSSDVGRAIAGTSTDAGVLPDPITAMISGMNDYLLFATENGLWLLRGAPAAGGRIDSISRIIGIAHPEAYCHGPAGEIIFLSRDGLYMLPPGAAAVPQSVSREVIPRELVRINTTQTRILMQYNVLDQGLHIFVSSEIGSTTRSFWFDWRTRSFWPETYQADHQPYSIHSHLFPGEDQRIVLIGSHDGYIRRYALRVDADDGTAISSYVDYGPLALGTSGMGEGVVTQLNARMAAESAQVSWEMRVGETPEEAKLSSAFDSGTWLNGLNYTDRPRARGAYAYLRILNSTAYRSWAVETLFMAVRKAGRLRKS